MPQNEERQTIKSLYVLLLKQARPRFPADGSKIDAPEQRGVYLIYDRHDVVFHVGSTPKGQRGIAKRLRDHLNAASSFTNKELNGDGSLLRDGFTFQYLVVEDARHRALLEAYAIGALCPKHIGHGI
jgi:excinuclease UvrABC nuclease subunit